MKQFNKDQKEKYSKIANDIFKLKNEFDSISCQLLMVKDYILSQENRDKILRIQEMMNDIVNELASKSR